MTESEHNLLQAAAAVRAADHARYRAMIARDYDTLDRFLGDRLIYTHSDGRSDSKDEYLGRLRAGAVFYRNATTSDLIVHIYGDTAVMRGRVILEVTRATGDVVLTNLFLAVWVKAQDNWIMVGWASTPIPAS